VACVIFKIQETLLFIYQWLCHALIPIVLFSDAVISEIQRREVEYTNARPAQILVPASVEILKEYLIVRKCSK